jgi:hypothetical protein
VEFLGAGWVRFTAQDATGEWFDYKAEGPLETEGLPAEVRAGAREARKRPTKYVIGGQSTEAETFALLSRKTLLQADESLAQLFRAPVAAVALERGSHESEK